MILKKISFSDHDAVQEDTWSTRWLLMIHYKRILNCRVEMLRRVNVYGVCIAGALCLLLLLAGSRYTDNVNYRPAFDHRRNIKNLLRLSPDDEALQNVDPVTEWSNSKEHILEQTRARIRYRLANFTVGEGGKLDDLIPEAGGRPLQSIIVSSWRSGTTFLGEVLDAVPGNFYHYEPLLTYDIVQIRGPPHANAALARLRSMLQCNFTNMNEYFQFGRTHRHQFSHNKRLWEHCKYDLELCVDADFTSRFCRLFPFQSMKLVRLRLRVVEKLLADKELRVKILLLVRDPRAVMLSRRHREFCPPAPDCWDTALLCADMVSDYSAALRLLNLYPHAFMVLRYEDLALDTDATAHSLLEFLELGSFPEVDDFLARHTNVEVSGVSSTFRKSKEVPFRWKNTMSFDEVLTIQESCSAAMSLWGYRPVLSASQLNSTDFVPLEQFTVH